MSYPRKPSNTRTHMNNTRSEILEVKGLCKLLVTYTGIVAGDPSVRERAGTLIKAKINEVIEPQVQEWLRLHDTNDQPPTGCHISVHNLDFGLDIGLQFTTGINLPDSHLVDEISMLLGLHQIIEEARQPQPEPIAQIH
jgi:hypothetical protein